MDGRIIEQTKDHKDDPHPVSVQHLVDRLRYHDFFKLFPESTREELLRKASHRTYQAGETIYFRDDAVAYMGLVISGRVRMSICAMDGRCILLSLVEAGEVFGETSLIDNLPRTTDAQADTETAVMILRRDDFLPVLLTCPEAMLSVTTMLCHRIRIYLDTVDLIALQSLPIRLARLILRMAGEYGVIEDGLIVVRAGLNQASLGQQLATSRESINKQLKIFAADGIIRLHNDAITLLNAQELRNIGG